MVDERLPGIIIPNSIHLSGIDLHTEIFFLFSFLLFMVSSLSRSYFNSDANPLDKYCCFYSSGAGFCDYEEESNAHGFYQWNETPVGERDKQMCTHGNKPDYPDGIATRDCGPNGWMDYDGSACISNASNELTLLLEVNLVNL